MDKMILPDWFKQKENLFRGRTYDGIWLYGDLVQTNNGMQTGIIPIDYDLPGWKRVDPNTVGQFTGMCDQYKMPLYEWDIYLGKAYHLNGDGYIAKKFPRIIEQICVIDYNYNKSYKYPRVIRPVDEHIEAQKKYHYRGVQYQLDPLSKGSTRYNRDTQKWDIEGDGKTCHEITKIGNIFDHPYLLK